MSPQHILTQLWRTGVNVSLSTDGQNLTVPAGRLTADQRSLILANKLALVRFFVEAHGTTADLIAAAMMVCDQHGDGEAAREQMRRECLDTPPHLQRDLLDHFTGKRPDNLN